MYGIAVHGCKGARLQQVPMMDAIIVAVVCMQAPRRVLSTRCTTAANELTTCAAL